MAIERFKESFNLGYIEFNVPMNFNNWMHNHHTKERDMEVIIMQEVVKAMILKESNKDGE